MKARKPLLRERAAKSQFNKPHKEGCARSPTLLDTRLASVATLVRYSAVPPWKLGEVHMTMTLAAKIPCEVFQRSVVILHELNETIVKALHAEVMSNRLTQRDPSKLDTSAK